MHQELRYQRTTTIPKNDAAEMLPCLLLNPPSQEESLAPPALGLQHTEKMCPANSKQQLNGSTSRGITMSQRTSSSTPHQVQPLSGTKHPLLGRVRAFSWRVTLKSGTNNSQKSDNNLTRSSCCNALQSECHDMLWKHASQDGRMVRWKPNVLLLLSAQDIATDAGGPPNWPALPTQVGRHANNRAVGIRVYSGHHSGVALHACSHPSAHKQTLEHLRLPEISACLRYCIGSAASSCWTVGCYKPGLKTLCDAWTEEECSHFPKVFVDSGW
jgi:hypothetical protein